MEYLFGDCEYGIYESIVHSGQEYVEKMQMTLVENFRFLDRKRSLKEVVTFCNR